MSEHVPVKSSQIESICHDADEERLEVKFKKGGTWQYKNVPREVYEALLKAESVGSYFHRNIKSKDKYPANKIHD